VGSVICIRDSRRAGGDAAARDDGLQRIDIG
jgi:hypothetical protein